ncbi:unnamed protein product [Symbiodinium natans]|uniref:Uncharacterized protein n=1 Tax=Symbiodinium natans TaxID=878477 RepID=A0A812JR50_9DINO|nr:unnamed protein product [Symbiodinium natans]
MANAADSQPFFEQHARKVGMEQQLLKRFITGGVRTVSMAAYAATQPGQPLTDKEDNPTRAQLTVVKRLLFECRTMSLANLEATVGQQPDSELAQGKPAKELVLDASGDGLSVQDKSPKVAAQLGSDMATYRALPRRGLAYDLVGVLNPKAHEKRLQKDFDTLQTPAPPGFNRPTLQQVLRADRALWRELGSKQPTLKRAAAKVPLADARCLDQVFLEATNTVAVNFHFMPTPRAEGFTDKGGKGGKGETPMPAALRGGVPNDEHGDPLCFGFNLGSLKERPVARDVDSASALDQASRAALTARVTLARTGLDRRSVGVDKVRRPSLKGKILQLVLLLLSHRGLLWKWLGSPGLAAVWLAPPCGTSSRAKEI